MKKVAIIALMVVAIAGSLFSQAKPGGIARQVAMGGSQAGAHLVLNPFIMDDPALMLVNPAYVAMYKDYGWMNVAGGGLNGNTSSSNTYGHQNAGVAFGLNSDWTFGAVLSYDPSAVNTVNTLISSSGFVTGRNPQSIPQVANVWEVVAANHSTSLDWGFGVSYGWSNSDAKGSSTSSGTSSSASREASSNVWGFRAGVNAPFGDGNSLDLSAALHLDKATDMWDQTNNSTVANLGHYSASGTEMQVNARAKFNVSSKFNFVPYGTFINISAEPKQDAPPTGGAAVTATNKYTATAFAFGAGGEYHTSTFFLAGGLSWQSFQVKQELTTIAPTTTTNTFKYSALPVVNLGGEWWFVEWLAGRVGYYRSLGNVNQKSESASAGGTSTGESNVSFPNSLLFIGDIPATNDQGLITMGLGMKFGGWSMDATVSEEALRRGFGVVGASDNINTFGYITGSYFFGGGE